MEPLVTMRHVRAAGYCARGVRQMAERHHLDLRRFCREGLPASQLEATGDALCLRVAAKAREEAAHG